MLMGIHIAANYLHARNINRGIANLKSIAMLLMDGLGQLSDFRQRIEQAIESHYSPCQDPTNARYSQRQMSIWRKKYRLPCITRWVDVQPVADDRFSVPIPYKAKRPIRGLA